MIKTLAMLSVVALHVFPYSYVWRFSNYIYDASVIAIPLFFMTSGYLLLGENKTSKLKYISKKIFSIIRLVFVFSLMVWIVYLIKHSTNIKGFFSVFFGAFVQKGVLFHFWYFGALIIIYALLPLLNLIYCRKKILIIFFFFLSILEFLCFLENVLTTPPWEERIIQSFRLWNWLFYFMLGGIIKLFITKQHPNRMEFYCALVLVLLLVCIIFQEHYKNLIGSPFCEYYYSSFIVAVFSTTLFIFILQLDIKTNSFGQKVLSWISPLFLYVYILHPFAILLASRICSNHYIIYLLTLAISILASTVFIHVPYLKRLTSL